MAVDVIDSQDPFGLNNLVRTNLLSTEDRMMRLGRQADIYEKLTASLAPSIWSMDDVKKGILCQLFGATVKVRVSVIYIYPLLGGGAFTFCAFGIAHCAVEASGRSRGKCSILVTKLELLNDCICGARAALDHCSQSNMACVRCRPVPVQPSSCMSSIQRPENCVHKNALIAATLN